MPYCFFGYLWLDLPLSSIPALPSYAGASKKEQTRSFLFLSASVAPKSDPPRPWASHALSHRLARVLGSSGIHLCVLITAMGRLLLKFSSTVLYFPLETRGPPCPLSAQCGPSGPKVSPSAFSRPGVSASSGSSAATAPVVF